VVGFGWEWVVEELLQVPAELFHEVGVGLAGEWVVGRGDGD